MRPSFLWLATVLLACDGAGNDTNDNDDTGDDTDTEDTDTGGGDTDTDVNNGWNGEDNYGPAPTRAPDQVITGNLLDGSIPSDTTWIEEEPFYCGAAVYDSFTGAHVYHT